MNAVSRWIHSATLSIALGMASFAYVAFGVGRVRLKRTMLATSAGTTFSSASAEILPGSIGAGRFGTLLGWFAVFFAGTAVLLRTIASHRGP